jgi:prepilin-type N-terminal cleavage/methylation domain-containing protein
MLEKSLRVENMTGFKKGNDMRTAQFNKGFTLVELSIVLVIVGLLIATITAGQRMIYTSKIHNQVSDLRRYKIAIQQFKIIYDYLPGDMPNASSYWTSCVTVGASSCDGNGDGLLKAAAYSSENDETEGFRGWQHLSLSGLIDEQYTALPIDEISEGVNLPYFVLDKAGSIGLRETVMEVGLKGTYDVTSDYALVKVFDALAIEIKIDDKFPGTGNIRVLRGWDINNTSGRCIDSSDSPTADSAFILTDELKSCRMRVSIY